MNGARAAAIRKLLHEVEKYHDHFLPASEGGRAYCKLECNALSLSAFMSAITKSGLRPLIESSRNSVVEILINKAFTHLQCRDHARACNYCQSHLRSTALTYIRNRWLGEDQHHHFDGLCLDCINNTALNDTDEQYWYHAHMGNFSFNCRVDHGESTWYWSYMGRASKMIEYHVEKQKRWRNQIESVRVKAELVEDKMSAAIDGGIKEWKGKL